MQCELHEITPKGLRLHLCSLLHPLCMHILSTCWVQKISLQVETVWPTCDTTCIIENFEDDRFGETRMIMIGPYAYELQNYTRQTLWIQLIYIFERGFGFLICRFLIQYWFDVDTISLLKYASIVFVLEVVPNSSCSSHILGLILLQPN